MDDFNTILENFNKELVTDLKMDEFSLKEKVMLAPVIKHKWVARTMQYKNAAMKLKNTKREFYKKIASESAVPLSKSAIETIVLNTPDYQKLIENLEKIETLIEFLEKVEKLTSSLTFDYKNAIDIQKLETT